MRNNAPTLSYPITTLSPFNSCHKISGSIFQLSGFSAGVIDGCFRGREDMPEKISPYGQPPSAAAMAHQTRAIVPKGKPFRTEKIGTK